MSKKHHLRQPPFLCQRSGLIFKREVLATSDEKPLLMSWLTFVLFEIFSQIDIKILNVMSTTYKQSDFEMFIH